MHGSAVNRRAKEPTKIARPQHARHRQEQGELAPRIVGKSSSARTTELSASNRPPRENP